MEKLVEMGVPKAVASVVLPLGYAFNRDGSIMYFALAVGFLADAYNIPLDPSTLLSIIVVTTLASKGSANVPSGGLVAIAVVLTTIGIPVEALAIIAGVDAFSTWGAPPLTWSAIRLRSSWLCAGRVLPTNRRKNRHRFSDHGY